MKKEKSMNLYVVAYRLKDSDTVVIKKSQIKNAKEEDFEEISLFIPESFIKEKYERMNDPFLNDDEEDDDEDDDDEYNKDVQKESIVELDKRVCKNCMLFRTEVKRVWRTKPSCCIKDYKEVKEDDSCDNYCKQPSSKCESCEVYNCIHNDVNDCDEGHAF